MTWLEICWAIRGRAYVCAAIRPMVSATHLFDFFRDFQPACTYKSKRSATAGFMRRSPRSICVTVARPEIERRAVNSHARTA